MLTNKKYTQTPFVRSPFLQSSKNVNDRGVCFLSCSSRVWYFRPCCIIRGRRQQWLTGMTGQSEDRSLRSCKVQPMSDQAAAALSGQSHTWLPASAVYHWCYRRDSSEQILMYGGNKERQKTLDWTLLQIYEARMLKRSCLSITSKSPEEWNRFPCVNFPTATDFNNIYHR